MNSLKNRRILLGICGGIAAYKSAELVRLLVKSGAEVRVIMTSAAQEFITALTLQALSGNPVHTELLNPEAEAGMGHIELARWADVLLIAPATANTLASLAHGSGRDLLSTVCLASAAPLLVAPAMNQQMWLSAATQENIACLRDRGVQVLGPAAGIQACGDVGMGRMEEPGDLVEALAAQFNSAVLAGRKVVITAGPTREAIDPVRFISNHSSGKMGYALAQAAADAGAEVVLISGPVHLAEPERVAVVRVDSAQQMLEQSLLALDAADIFIGAAAVADYRVAQIAEHKIKKTHSETIQLELVRNPDIISEVAAREPRVFVVGFAAETQHIEQYALGKLRSKGLDMIIANDVSDKRIGFNSDDNAVTVFEETSQRFFEQQNKTHLARALIKHIALASMGRR